MNRACFPVVAHRNVHVCSCVGFYKHACVSADVYRVSFAHVMYIVYCMQEHKPNTVCVCCFCVSLYSMFFPHWTVSEHCVLPLVPGTHSRMRRTCSWWWTSCWEEICATTCSRASSSARTLSNSTSVRWHWRLTTYRTSTSSTGTQSSFLISSVQVSETPSTMLTGYLLCR